jgi:hypothetical protein
MARPNPVSESEISLGSVLHLMLPSSTCAFSFAIIELSKVAPIPASISCACAWRRQSTSVTIHSIRAAEYLLMG